MSEGGHTKSSPPAISVRDLTYAYPQGERILNGVSFTALRGETIAVAGLSGCGKSTLCCCLTGLAPKVLGGELGGCIELFGEHIAPSRRRSSPLRWASSFKTRATSW